MKELKMNSNELKQRILQEAKEIESYIIKTRRHIHKYPETAFEEVKTRDLVEQQLKQALQNFPYTLDVLNGQDLLEQPYKHQHH